ncbi:hypothetical protein RFI_28000 [Reticulomyxa filosa]|uniref:Phospholipase B-like n=1 Tax=Reticulomyxa filosa TaxID=46433 RepID=X6M8Q1_RETFI|nr:hypothetical protein RFI_28000 [Reticulomyxa filosa]|eukprot:ETO09375.1 hypothetical protein RFI_28000 [Reticulomyxa filosa]
MRRRRGGRGTNKKKKGNNNNNFFLKMWGQMETTNDIANASLYDFVVPQSLYTWQRARIANALASNGYDWTRTFARYNSGTYNNQWMALTYSLFVPGQPLADGLLWICEQVCCVFFFFFELLTFNTNEYINLCTFIYTYIVNQFPAIEYTYNVSGNAALAATYGPTLSYDLAPRARLFRKMANQCNNITTTQKFMRYNDYKNDPLENGDPGWAIMSRFDLEDEPSPSGGYDTKLSNFAMLQSLSSWVQAGPTHDNVPPFSWDQFPDVVHTGMPLTYNFDWHVIKPQLN